MKFIVIFAALLAISLAAPAEVASIPESVVDSQEAVKVEEKVVAPLEKVEDKGEVETEEKVAEATVVDQTADVAVAKDEVKPVTDVLPAVEKVATTKTDETLTEEEKEKENAAEKDKLFQEYSDICRATTGATVEQIEPIGKEPLEDAPKVVKCYIKCIAEQLGVVRDGVLQKDVALASNPGLLSSEEIDTAAESCSGLEADDACDSAYLRYSCYFRSTNKKIRII